MSDHYGALQGRGKPEVMAEAGQEQFMLWRRGLRVRPPQGEPDDDSRYATLPRRGPQRGGWGGERETRRQRHRGGRYDERLRGSRTRAMTHPPRATHAPVSSPRSMPLMKALLAAPASSAPVWPPILAATSSAAPSEPRMV
jgi:hypothetical protein